ncbi:expressed protein, partial [Phakopsora pachyrhizi]
MRLDELERLSDEVLEEEPHRRIEFSFPSDGASQLGQSEDLYHFEEEAGNRRPRKEAQDPDPEDSVSPTQSF